MRKFLFLLAACLVLGTSLPARAYEYEFNLQEMGKNVYQPVQSYDGGITVYIHTDGDQAPNLHAWKANGDITTWPGVKMTELVAVNVKGDDNNKKGYYRMHFDETEMGIIVNFNGDGDKTTDTHLIGEGSYFFDYNGEGGSTLQQDDEYYTDYTPASHDKVNLYVRVMDSDQAPYAYYWGQYDHPDWNQNWAHHQFTETVTINGESWYYMQIDKQFTSVIFTTNVFDNQTADINGLTPGNHYFKYYPNGSGQKYMENGFAMGGHANNYDEYTFHPFWTVDGSVVTITTENEHGTATIKMQCTSEAEASKVKLIDGKYLFVPKGTTFTGTQGNGNALNEMYLGRMPSTIGGNTDIQFGNEVDGIVDYAGKGTSDNYFVAGMKEIDAGTTSISCTMPSWSGDAYLGPNMMIRDEVISSEDLTFSDHNTMGQYFLLNDDLVGVQVVEIGTNNKKSYLICRSLNPISDAHKHKLQDGQEIWVNTKGQTPAYANPATPQYAWIGLEISNPEQYINKTISNVRGIYYPDALNGQAPNASFGGTSEFYNYKMFNPIFKVVGAPVCGTETVKTTLNTYCTANLCEQDGKKYFFMEPRPFEIAKIVDVMRTDDQVLWVPTEDAILPDGQTVNEYTEAGITGWAAIIDRSYDMWEESDKELFGEQGQNWAWRLKDKVYDVPNALVMLATYNPNNNPLDQPNRDYYGWSSNLALGYHIQGKAHIREYEEDMVVGKGDYWSRYEYGDNKNAYRNDIEITIYKPNLNLNEIGNMWVQRIDAEGNVTNIAKLMQQGTSSNFTMSYVNETQTARNDEKLAEVAQDFDKAPFGEGQYNLQQANIGISDMFYSSLMDTRENNGALSKHFEYQVVPFEGNTNELSCVVTSAPVYKTNENSVSRATYTQKQVDDDVENQLEQKDIASITFTPNMERGMTEYRVYKAQQGATEGGKKWEVALANIKVDDYGFLNPTFTDDITGETYEYVPEVYTAYNNNTYGCYKQVVSDALINMTEPVLTASEYTGADGSKYCLATVTINSKINNSSKDTRYLVRLWREVGGVKTLLNDQEEIVFNKKTLTSYSSIDDLIDTDEPITIADVFKVNQVTAGLMAEGETADIQDVTYYATLYVKDNASEKFYVKKINKTKSGQNIPTAITTVNGGAQVESVRYYNVAGIESEKPFAGMNIVVTRYSDGTTTTTKVVK